MPVCKNYCTRFEKGGKHTAYNENGGFCSSCNYYFKEWFLTCPCCKQRIRHVSRLSLPKPN